MEIAQWLTHCLIITVRETRPAVARSVCGPLLNKLRILLKLNLFINNEKTR